MQINKLTLPDIPENALTPVVRQLLSIIQQQGEQVDLLREENQKLRDEIAVLKDQKPKPEIKASKLENPGNPKDPAEKRPGSDKKSKKKTLVIHKTVRISPEEIPAGSVFKGIREYDVQDVVIEARNTRYLLEQWQTPEGKYIVGELPQEITQDHFGAGLCSYILDLYYGCHVTQPLLHEHLMEIGIDISSGQLSRILTERKEEFHAEKNGILRVGLEVSSYVQTDDTGARHDGKNGFCTFIGNEFFSWFESTDSKSRINFLELLNAGHINYVLNADAIFYLKQMRFPKAQLHLLEDSGEICLSTQTEWKDFLASLGIKKDLHIKFATEAALIASAFEQGLRRDLVILSDDAGQFEVRLLFHALCWIHAERTIKKLIPYTEDNRKALEDAETKIWQLYEALKQYKISPAKESKARISVFFDEIFTTKTCFISLNLALQRIYENKKDLLLVLDHPEIPLHNNDSEQDIREYVKRRKISGSTRSPSGRQCRDTFTSLKKTCRKLGVTFWQYLQDRLSKTNAIPQLSELIRQRAAGPPQEYATVA